MSAITVTILSRQLESVVSYLVVECFRIFQKNMVPVWLEFCATKAHFQIILVVQENGFSIDILSLNVNFT